MARLVVLAVLLATAAYAAGEKKVLKLKSCTGTDAQCTTCPSAAVEYKIDGDKCQASSKGSYLATCTSTADWGLKVYDGTDCSGTATKSITASAQCFDDTKSITAKVMSIALSGTKYDVKVRVCEASTTAQKCYAVDKCDEKAITVPTTKDACGNLGQSGKGPYYTATGDATKVTLTLYATAEDCEKEQLPLFWGENMVPPEDTCKTFQHNLNANSCESSTLKVAKCTTDTCSKTCTEGMTYSIDSTGACQGTDPNMHKATCPTTGGWTLDQYSGSDCSGDATNSVLTNSITAAGKCFTREMRAKVTEVTESGSNHEVKVRVCKAEATEKKCTDNDDTDCPEKTITVPTSAGKTCGPLDSSSEKGLHCTASIVGGDKVTLAVYANAGECASEKLPLFKGEMMAKGTCTTFKQNLYATKCEGTELKLSSCTTATCDTCDDEVEYATADDTCQGSSTKYKAKCAEGKPGDGWKLETFSDNMCDAAKTIYTIASTGQCYHKSITAKVMSIEEKGQDNKYPVKVRVCKADATTQCSAVGTDDTNCPEYTVHVPIKKDMCGRLAGAEGLFYTAAGMPDDAKPKKVTLALYATADDCQGEKRPVFKGVDMEAPKDTCKTYKQKLNAEACEADTSTSGSNGKKTKKTATVTIASNTAASTGAGDGGSPGESPAGSTTAASGTKSTASENNSTIFDGSAAVSSVLALFLAACAVCMM